MKKLFATAGLLMFFGVVFAGGLLTNGNQSAQYIRMLSRNASTTYDAVYFNPAGLMKMDNGFYVAIHSQTLFQTKTITSGYPYLNDSKYEGEVTVPVFPTGFAIYKLDKVAFSLGFGPNSGGGSAEYGEGLPSFEKTISGLVPGLAGLAKLNQNVTNYKTAISFKGESIFWGIQGGASYKINDMFAVYGGARYVPATNTYSGYIKNIEVKVNGAFKNAATFLGNEIAPALKGMANQSTAAASSVQPLISGGAGGLTLAQANGAGLITAAQRAQLEGGLLGLGATSAQISAMPITTVQGTYNAGAATLNGQAAQMTATGAQLADKSVDVKQTGSGITPIIGVNITPVEGLNIGMKYEFKTTLKLTNATTIDGTGMFPDGAETSSDLPALFSVGADYKVNPDMNFSISYNNYNDKGVNWGKNIYGEPRTISDNCWELSVGAQRTIVKGLAVSVGYLHTDMGVTHEFNSDFSYYSNSNTFGAGFEIKPMANLTIDLGMLLTNYDSAVKSFKDTNPAIGNYVEMYDKHNLGFAIGLGYHFGAK
jgi:long-subunit fatty acid transport protein